MITSPELIDLWTRLHRLFDHTEGTQVEIVIVNVSQDAMRQLLGYLVANASQLSTGFHDLYEREIQPGSVEFAIDRIVTGHLLGILAMHLTVDGYSLPYMGFVIHDTDFLSLAYEMGVLWSPMGLIALFEFFRIVKWFDPEALIALNPYQFTMQARSLFELTLREYLNEKISA